MIIGVCKKCGNVFPDKPHPKYFCSESCEFLYNKEKEISERAKEESRYRRDDRNVVMDKQKDIIYSLFKKTIYGKIKWERVGEFSYRAKISEDGIIAEIAQYMIDYFTLFFMDSTAGNDILWGNSFEAMPWNEDFADAVECFITVRDIYKIARNNCHEEKNIIKNLAELEEKRE
jgi:hypothetical protein